MKRLIVGAVVVAALGGAGVAGAIAEGTTSLKPGQWARLGASSTYCEAVTENQANSNRPAFDCGVWAGNSHVARTYSAIIDRLGVEVDRWDQAGRHARSVATYLNP